MNFDLTDEQRAFQDSIANYLNDACTIPAVLATFEAQSPPALQYWSGLMELGVGGLTIPEQFGGFGLELLDLAAVVETAGRFVMPGPLIEHAMAAYAISLGGTEAQQARWLPDLASGRLRATVALTEGQEGWMPGDWHMPCDDTLNGAKHYVPDALDADLIVVGLSGGRMAVVERGANGLELTALPSLDGSRRLYQVTFNATPAELLPAAQECAQRICDVGLVLLAADAYGGAKRCIEMSVEYARQRVQFGQQIGKFQAVKHQLADLAVEVEPAAGLYWYAAHAFDHERPDKASKAAALAKAHLTDVYTAASRRMIELHGGIGYTWELGAHLWLKRAVFDHNYLGRPSLHRARYASMAGW
ncbi:acyl-CoA dehydrogenase family protein [Noviherbaspirillum sedimenti]|uniref:Acyl-CoA dehydrogenase n=1 Tax=Noviherbaspirillum sedimenti TaxID=2320865 RepID=A0A3A3FZ62_9BURK|nr:acyl-CoA dehydrogenase family protein [Noviherbaspirillum sedimenti]RJG00645.1 acyl-CoA dehydrogenase [Noviherbaspirillum sedimenti]